MGGSIPPGAIILNERSNEMTTLEIISDCNTFLIALLALGSILCAFFGICEVYDGKGRKVGVLFLIAFVLLGPIILLAFNNHALFHWR